MDMAVQPLPQKHDVLWFADGNVVLATDDLLFRVYKGALAMHSTVLRDMFDLPEAICSEEGTSSGGENAVGGAMRPDLYDGSPMVVLAGDKGEDVAHLLRAIFQQGYYNRDDNDTPLDIIIALLTLSGKYDIESVRSDVLKQLSRHYPRRLKEYESLNEDASLFGRPRKECHFPLLRAASITSQSQTDIRVILPTLFLCCSTFSMSHIMNVEAPLLPLSTLQTLALGKYVLEELIRATTNSMVDRLLRTSLAGCQNTVNSQQCTSIKGIPARDLARQYASLTKSILIFQRSEATGSYFETLCLPCQRQISKYLETQRELLWVHRLPDTFGFENWVNEQPEESE